MVLPLIQELWREIKTLATNTDRQFAGVNERLERVDGRLANKREAIDGASILGCYAAAEVGDRSDSIETRLAAIESRS